MGTGEGRLTYSTVRFFIFKGYGLVVCGTGVAEIKMVRMDSVMMIMRERIGDCTINYLSRWARWHSLECERVGKHETR